MKNYNLINQRATTCKHGGHCEWIACDKCSHYEPDVLNQQPCEDCRNCKEWNRCPCGKEGHENGTSIGYSIGECKNYEPCEDCISRQAVLDLVVSNHIKLNELNVVMYSPLCKDIKALPSVTPKEKTGHWIDTDEWRETVDGFEQWGYFRKCSKCGYVFKFLEIDNYCPNCGCHMVEPQESEERNEQRKTDTGI